MHTTWPNNLTSNVFPKTCICANDMYKNVYIFLKAQTWKQSKWSRTVEEIDNLRSSPAMQYSPAIRYKNCSSEQQFVFDSQIKFYQRSRHRKDTQWRFDLFNKKEANICGVMNY